MDGGRHVGIDEPQSVAAVRRCRLIGKPKVIKRAIEPVAGTIAGKDAAGAIAAVRCGSKPDDEQPRIRRAEARNGPAPVVPIDESADLFSRHPLAIFHQSRTSPAIHNLALGGPVQHSGVIIPKEGNSLAGNFDEGAIMTIEERLARIEHDIDVLKREVRELFEKFHKYIEETTTQD